MGVSFVCIPMFDANSYATTNTSNCCDRIANLASVFFLNSRMSKLEIVLSFNDDISIMPLSIYLR